MKPITHRPKVGEVLECDFGQWAEPPSFNGHLPPEIRKRRLVVVLNGNLSGLCLVVPISSTPTIGIAGKYHVPLDASLFEITDFYDKRDRWAKAELVQPVSTARLFHVFGNGRRIEQRLSFEIVEKIQIAAIQALSAGRLLQKNSA